MGIEAAPADGETAAAVTGGAPAYRGYGGLRGEAYALVVFLAAAAVVALSVALAIARPLTWLVRVVPDDAFYYLQIARNLAREGRSTFDGINSADGYHPGWMLVVVALAAVVHGKVALLRASLAVALLLHLAAGYCLTRVFRCWLPPMWSWLGGACWLLNPLPVMLVLEDTEGPLNVLALTIAVWVYLGRIAPQLERDLPVPLRDRVLFGLALGGCVLARTDEGVLGAVAVLAILRALRGSRERLEFLIAVGGAAALTVAPWFIYTHATTGAWVQHSGSMKILWAAREHTAGIGPAWRYVTGKWLTYPYWARTLERVANRWPSAMCAASTVVTCALVYALVRGFHRPDTRRLAATALTLVAGTLLTGTIYGLFFTDMQDWYRGQPALILYVVLYGVFVKWRMTRSPAPIGHPMAIGTVAVGACGATLVLVVLTANSYPWQRDVLESEAAFERLVPPGKNIGCFNAGIPAYFSDRRIINLDGLVNNAVFSYYQRGELDRYLTDAPIDYIADEDMSIARAKLFVASPVGLDEVAAVPLTWMPTVRRRLWRVEHPVSAR